MPIESENSKLLERIMEELRDIKLAQDRLRAEFAAGFTPLGIHNLEITNIREQMTAIKNAHDVDMARLERRYERDAEQAIGKNERLWLRAGSVIGILSLLVALLEYVQHLPH